LITNFSSANVNTEWSEFKGYMFLLKINRHQNRG
jgi:hypothetical protein